MLKLNLIVLLFIVNNTTAQTLKVSGKTVLKTFQKTILKNKAGGVTTGKSAWYSCNDDSAYFKSDTITLFFHPKMNIYSDCCNSISWTFYDKNKFLETKLQKCKEPPSASAAKKVDFYQARLIESTGFDILTLINSDGKNSNFKIIELIESAVENSNRLGYELILKRCN